MEYTHPQKIISTTPEEKDAATTDGRGNTRAARRNICSYFCAGESDAGLTGQITKKQSTMWKLFRGVSPFIDSLFPDLPPRYHTSSGCRCLVERKNARERVMVVHVV
jgi:hypothetical protein